MDPSIPKEENCEVFNESLNAVKIEINIAPLKLKKFTRQGKSCRATGRDGTSRHKLTGLFDEEQWLFILMDKPV